MTVDELRRETGVPVVIADHQGVILYVNERLERVFGWSASEIVGKPLTILIPTNMHDAHHLGFSRFLTTGKPTLLNQPLKLKAITKEGEVFDAEHCIIAEERQGQWVFGATIRPLDQQP
ncbi:MAG: PAS domain S-box protein [Candidatus Omnitrophica bacterium]|nr:PAS domain S-box protein [Candidatus Omnitrophota bacterium]